MSKSVGVAKWESSEFPLVCEECLGDNPFLRMLKENFGHDCKVCLKPFTTFKWSPGPKLRPRRTEICSSCSRLKGVCQSCLLDIKYGLPVQVRDTILGVKQVNVPKNSANREYFNAMMTKRVDGGGAAFDWDKVDAAGKAILEQLGREAKARRAANPPENKLKAPCSFYAKGTCTRGDLCPFRHQLSTERPSSLQSYRNRYYGENDPVAESLLKNTSKATLTSTDTPKDRTQKSLFIQGLRKGVGAAQVKRHFLKILEKSAEEEDATFTGTVMKSDDSAASISFADREDAIEVSKEVLGICEIEGVSLKISWHISKQNDEDDK